MREDTRYARFGTVRPRVQIPGPRPVFVFETALLGWLAGSGAAVGRLAGGARAPRTGGREAADCAADHRRHDRRHSRVWVARSRASGSACRFGSDRAGGAEPVLPDLGIWVTGVFPATTGAGILSLAMLHVVAGACAVAILYRLGLRSE